MTIPRNLSILAEGASSSGVLGTANGGTGSTSTQFVNLATNVTGTLPVANGGTGATSLTANNVLLGNGTSAVQTVAPGASGNILTSNGTTWTSAAAPAAGTITAVASGSLSNGAVVVVNSDGTVSAGAQTTVTAGLGTSAYTGANGGIGVTSICAVLASPTKLAVFVQNQSSGNFEGYIGTISGSTITFGSVKIIAGISFPYPSCAYSSSLDRFVLVGQDNTNSQTLTFFLLDGSLNVINSITPFGTFTYVQFQTACAFDSAGTKLCYTFQTYTGTYGTYQLNTGIVTVGTSSLSLSNSNGPYSPTYGCFGYSTLKYDAASNYFLFFGKDSGNNGYVRSLSASTGAANAVNTFSSAGVTNNISVAYNPTANNYTIVYSDSNTPGYAIGAVVASVNGTGFTFGSVASFSSGISRSFFNASYNPSMSCVDVVFINQSNSPNTIDYAKITVTGTTPSLASGPTTISAGGGYSYSTASANNSGLFYSSSSQKSALVYLSTASGSMGAYAAMLTTPGVVSNINSNNMIGLSSGAYTNGQTATVNVVGSTNNAQSGLTAGTKYYAQGDGTLSSSATTQPYVGVALSATKILVKG